MHDQIRNFSLEGDLDGASAVETRERLIHHLEILMRDYGYVPSIDNEPHFTREYDEATDSFKFWLTVYGAYVGKEKSWQISGVAGGKEIPFSTARTK